MCARTELGRVAGSVYETHTQKTGGAVRRANANATDSFKIAGSSYGRRHLAIGGYREREQCSGGDNSRVLQLSASVSPVV